MNIQLGNCVEDSNAICIFVKDLSLLAQGEKRGRNVLSDKVSTHRMCGEENDKRMCLYATTENKIK